ncbi:MAG: PPOX class F420-dependent oxidoreductase [Dehalococcoidia bacterium]
MSPAETPEELLKEANICVLATTGPGGQPHAMPMWYLYHDGVIIFSTGRGTQKHKNVERNGKATVVVDRRTPPYYAVMVKGDAEAGPPLSADLKFQLAARYLGEEGGKAYVSRGGDGDSVTIRVRPRKFVEFHGVSGRS